MSFRGAVARAALVLVPVVGCAASHPPKVRAEQSPDVLSCERGDASACLRLAMSLTTGPRGPADAITAAMLAERSCTFGSADGCALLAFLEIRDRGNQQRALELSKLACERGRAESCVSAAQALGNGAIAEPFYKRACALGNASACEWKQPSAPEFSTEQIAAFGRASSVLVATQSTSGSGFVVAREWVVTNHHVVEGEERIAVRTTPTDEFLADAIVPDRSNDLALVHVPGLPLTPLTLATAMPGPGAEVIAIGAPLGFDGSISVGVASGTRKAASGREWLQVSAPISPGSSGGAVFDRRGRVVGVATMTIVAAQNVNFAVPAAYVRDLLSAQRTPLPLKAFALNTRRLVPTTTEARGSAFPPAVGGFRFGSSVADASAACEEGFARVPGDTLYYCNVSPVRVPNTDGSAFLFFNGGALVRVARFSNSFDILNELTAKHGRPQLFGRGSKGDWAISPPAKIKRGQEFLAEWTFERGSVIRLRFDPTEKFKYVVLWVSRADREISEANY